MDKDLTQGKEQFANIDTGTKVSQSFNVPTTSQETQNYRTIPLWVKSLAIALTVVLIFLGYLYGSQYYVNDEPLKVIVSVPFNNDIGEAIANSTILAFEEAGYQAGGREVELVVLDDGDENGVWKEELEERNALAAAADTTVVAYLGPFNTGAAKVSMPILNRARIVQIASSNTWPGLTKSGFLPGEPGKFFPTGDRHYVRLVTTDDLQAPAVAVWASELGYESVYIFDDGESYGLGFADLFRARAEMLGMEVINQVSLDKTSNDFSAEVEAIKETEPDVVFYGGITRNGGALLLRQMREAEIETDFMASGGVFEPDFIEVAGPENAEGAYVCTPGALPEHVGTEAALIFADKYTDRFGIKPTAINVAAYEGANVLLGAIEQSETKTREDILKLVRRTTNYEGVLGNWSFDVRGDINSSVMSGHVVRNGEFEFVKLLEVP